MIYADKRLYCIADSLAAAIRDDDACSMWSVVAAIRDCADSLEWKSVKDQRRPTNREVLWRKSCGDDGAEHNDYYHTIGGGGSVWHGVPYGYENGEWREI